LIPLLQLNFLALTKSEIPLSNALVIAASARELSKARQERPCIWVALITENQEINSQKKKGKTINSVPIVVDETEKVIFGTALKDNNKKK
jgi:hypothetical protein